MDTLPVIVLRQIVEYLPSNADRLIMSLVCKRWFDQRQSYLHFYTDRMNLNKTGIINFNKTVTLNSYKQIINQDIINAPLTILLYTDPHQYINWDTSNRCILLNGDTWKQEVLAMRWIKKITFCDCPAKPMDKEFWDGTTEFFEALIARDGHLPKIQFNQRTRALPQQHVHLDALAISIYGDSNDDGGTFNIDALPPTLTSLRFNSYFWFVPHFDLTHLGSLKSLYLLHDIQRKQFDSSNLPPSLTKLGIELPSMENAPLVKLPPGITNLSLQHNYPLQGGHYLSKLELPAHYLRVLKFGDMDGSTLLRITSSNFPVLEHLIFEYKLFNEIPMDLSSLPSSLQRLNVSTYRPIASLPSSIEWLSIQFECKFQLSDMVWPSPSRIRTLHLAAYGHELKEGDIPTSITSLKLKRYNKPVHPSALFNGIQKLACIKE
ncbi:hypothetical protein SAMD00019534_026450 [Acytostelium subglobosum LB1]|uniref:hypothetical protein n=1 Tax=Acytostelium subglobosum LB1 TaxID=1410327 RepID=UPI0006451BE0|nr:hypothetical protein SAMD00019534_026450 [Acytostelium subglobosum LB1]GAM19470.1 hypothetical protein SAMD00019534_026450 [Acytostelium subglobosum LB1]|eukprot:XP_012757397.1 hypothetical protein SAMD00019534_026450 [Acytostelium subglobosum LB1]